MTSQPEVPAAPSPTWSVRPRTTVPGLSPPRRVTLPADKLVRRFSPQIADSMLRWQQSYAAAYELDRPRGGLPARRRVVSRRVERCRRVGA